MTDFATLREAVALIAIFPADALRLALLAATLRRASP